MYQSELDPGFTHHFFETIATLPGLIRGSLGREQGESTWDPLNASELAPNSANGLFPSLIAWAESQPAGNVATVSVFAREPTCKNLRAHDDLTISLQFQVLADMPLASRNTCTTVPVVNTCTTVPVAVSISALASRTSTPVIRLISCRSQSAESLNNWRWKS